MGVRGMCSSRSANRSLLAAGGSPTGVSCWCSCAFFTPKRDRAHHVFPSACKAALAHFLSQALEMQLAKAARAPPPSLPPDASPEAQAKVAKARRRIEIVPQRIAETEQMERRLAELQAELADAHADLRAVRARMEDGLGLGERLRTFDPDAQPQWGRPDGFAGLVIESPHGVPILVGRQGTDSDEEMRRVSRGTDLWFQLRDGRGARVLLRSSMCPAVGKGTRECMQMAADLAAYFSEARAAGPRVEVMYTDSRRVAARGYRMGQMKASKKLGVLLGDPDAVAAVAEEAAAEWGWGSR